MTDAAKDLLAERGYDPAFGARPLKRLIQRELGDRIALASSRAGSPRATWPVDVEDDDFVVRSTAPVGA